MRKSEPALWEVVLTQIIVPDRNPEPVRIPGEVIPGEVIGPRSENGP